MTPPLSSPLKLAKRLVRQGLLQPAQDRLAAHRIAQYVHAVRRGFRPDTEAIRRLRHAWGNEAYSADETYVAEVISRAELSQGPVLECGSGLTTLVVALVAEARGQNVWSLEQDAGWARFVQGRLQACAIGNVEIVLAPLKDHGGFVWYDAEALGERLPRQFGLALCDGPAVHPEWGAAQLQWRYGLLPTLARLGIGCDEVLLDDADEPRADNLRQRWAREFHLECQMLDSSDGACAVFRRPPPSA
ncbi:hypothetical protein [Pelomonas sp. SE-A7]|uniref:hypothetical protein n=1 Tax=Pelomonas sp. SE-A7 TaxID=3054953 RepID=UPI00259CCEAD|nr:hypothetical protein [Pelomonas sp. SE-A7]MDM4767170.1 hypothetical protein [Pelomonas sp. SE-A7]